MGMRIVREIAQQEFIINSRNKWTIIFAAVFGILLVSVSYFGIAAEGFAGVQNFSRTTASILNLVLYIVPLVALTMGTLSFTGEKGATELLFAQPVARNEVLLGKLLGLFLSITISTLIGFLFAGAIIVEENGLEGIIGYAVFVLLSLILSLVFLSIAVVIAMASNRKSKAFGIALFAWFFFVLLYDLLTIGGTMLLRGQSANYFLFLSLFGNPVDMVRVTSLIVLDNIAIFGASGAVLLRFLGGTELSIVILCVGLFAWIIVPFVISYRMMDRQDI